MKGRQVTGDLLYVPTTRLYWGRLLALFVFVGGDLSLGQGEGRASSGDGYAVAVELEIGTARRSGVIFRRIFARPLARIFRSVEVALALTVEVMAVPQLLHHGVVHHVVEAYEGGFFPTLECRPTFRNLLQELKGTSRLHAHTAPPRHRWCLLHEPRRAHRQDYQAYS